jgi:hypothetical protein
LIALFRAAVIGGVCPGAGSREVVVEQVLVSYSIPAHSARFKYSGLQSFSRLGAADMEEKPTVLILCTGNSCRSQMAEGVLRRELALVANALSAGSAPSGFVHPMAIQVMKEIGIDLGTHRSKPMAEIVGPVDTVITVCDKVGLVHSPCRIHTPTLQLSQTTGKT